MSDRPAEDALTRELARTLVVGIQLALGPGASPAAARAAMDAAQVLGLAELARLLGRLAPLAGRPWPPEAAPAVAALAELARRCKALGTIEPMRAAAAELDAWAGRLAELDGAGGEAAAGAPATLSVAEVLEDLPLADDGSRERAGRARMSAPVAAALRAALEWLEEEGHAPRPLRVTREESVVEVVLPGVNHDGLRPAEKVLSAVGGVLMPAATAGTAARGGVEWIVRAPSHAGRHSHLMLRQGGVALALPWHAVLRLVMVPAVEVRSGFGGLNHPVVEPVQPLDRSRGEVPVVLIGHGLKRAYLVADQLVWRLEAEPCEAPEPAAAESLTSAVRTADGQVFWVLDPARALARIEPPAIAPPAPATAAADVPPELRADDVEPLNGGAGAATAVEPSVAPAPAAAAAAALPAAAPARIPGPRRALVAEDSIAARLFLARMLEREGFAVRAVTRAAELFDELVDESWSLILVDVDLPNGAPDQGLAGVAARLASRGATTPVVALVRDAADVAVAAAAGVGETLLKPFERPALTALLARLGLGAEEQ